jgi:hypothetical protein
MSGSHGVAARWVVGGLFLALAAAAGAGPGPAIPAAAAPVVRDCIGPGPLSTPEASVRVCWRRQPEARAHTLNRGTIEVGANPGWRIHGARVRWDYAASTPGRVIADAAPRGMEESGGRCTVELRRYALRDAGLRVPVVVAVPSCPGIVVTSRRGARSFVVRATVGGEAPAEALGADGAVLTRGAARAVFRAEFRVCRDWSTCVDFRFVRDGAADGRWEGRRREARGPW